MEITQVAAATPVIARPAKRNQGLGATAQALDPARRNVVFAQDAAALDYAPARRLQRGIDVLGSGFSFIHVSGASYVPQIASQML